MLVHVLYKHLPRHQEPAGKVGVDHGFPTLGADGLQRCHELTASIVDQAIDTPVALDDGTNQAANRLFLANVAGIKTAETTVLGDFVVHRLKFVHLAAHQHHLRSQ